VRAALFFCLILSFEDFTCLQKEERVTCRATRKDLIKGSVPVLCERIAQG